jgi:hypothetical protein
MYKCGRCGDRRSIILTIYAPISEENISLSQIIKSGDYESPYCDFCDDYVNLIPIYESCERDSVDNTEGESDPPGELVAVEAAIEEPATTSGHYIEFTTSRASSDTTYEDLLEGLGL